MFRVARRRLGLSRTTALRLERRAAMAMVTVTRDLAGALIDEKAVVMMVGVGQELVKRPCSALSSDIVHSCRLLTIATASVF